MTSSEQGSPPSQMTEAQLDEIRQRMRQAFDEMYHQLGVPNPHIPSVIQLGWDDAPKLFDEVKRLRAENAAMREIVEAMSSDDALVYRDERTHVMRCVFNCTDLPQLTGFWNDFVHSERCPVTKARALVQSS